MRLSELLRRFRRSLAPRERLGDGDPVRPRLRYDSREVAPGDLFVALRGSLADGHDYLAQAVELGAAALVVEALPASLPAGASRSSWPTRAARSRRSPTAFFGHPADELALVGITGTNGKTSTTLPRRVDPARRGPARSA